MLPTGIDLAMKGTFHLPFPRFCFLGIIVSLLASCRSLSPPADHETPQKITVKQAEADFNRRWYLARRNPDIYCPTGYQVTAEPVKSYILGSDTFECIPVADGSIRFYIPPGPLAAKFRKEALAYREASKGIADKTREKFAGASSGLITLIISMVYVMGVPLPAAPEHSGKFL